jgi:hypothetical protein
MEWFSPLTVNDSYHSDISERAPADETTTQPSNEQRTLLTANAWTLDEIVSIVDDPAFFGWLGTNETRELLSSKEPGAYIFRFSGSTPGSYTLTLSLGNHWRISCEKLGKGQLLMKLENKSFQNFAEIVQIYQVLPLKSTVDSKLDVTLKTSCDRSKDILKQQ